MMSMPHSHKGLLLFVLSVAIGLTGSQTYAQTASRSGAAAAQSSPGDQKIAANSKAGHTTFLLFYRGNDQLTQTVYQTLKSGASKRKDAAILPIQVDDRAERGLIERFDITRTPLPAIVSLAPNGAVTGVFSQQIKPEEVDGAVVSAGYAKCIKAMQSGQIVLLCVQPATRGFVPKGVQDFQADRLYRERTQVVNISATDPGEALFVKQLGLNARSASPQVVFMAPPGVMLGAYDANVTHAALATKLASAGKCCDDKNCKHNPRTATGASSTTTR